MAKTREELHEYLVSILGSRNVYFQPPESKKMKYPAIVYSVNNVDKRHAENKVYMLSKAYKITVIDYDPENPVLDVLNNLEKCRFNTHYVSDSLNHDVYILYY